MWVGHYHDHYHLTYILNFTSVHGKVLLKQWAGNSSLFVTGRVKQVQFNTTDPRMWEAENTLEAAVLSDIHDRKSH